VKVRFRSPFPRAEAESTERTVPASFLHGATRRRPFDALPSLGNPLTERANLAQTTGDKMKNIFWLLALCGIAAIAATTFTGWVIAADEPPPAEKPAGAIKLPEPRHDSTTSVESALRQRRSVREFSQEPLKLADVSQLLWAAQGITDTKGKRTAPSAGALYPLEVFLAAGNVDGLPAGVYRYRPQGHELRRAVEGDVRAKLASAALGQQSVKDAAATIIIAGVYERTAKKYGPRVERYVHIEVGHAAENVQLQAVALNLGSVVVGAFDDAEVKQVLTLADNEQPLCLMPVGKPRR
jgi:SagB-type dehydrogenase family enzyme